MKFTTYDIIVIVLYLLLSFGLGYCFNQSETGIQKNILMGYALGTQFFLYAVNYRSLRNIFLYLFWCLVGFIHFYLYWLLKNDVMLMEYKWNAAIGLRNTIILLMLFQVLRIVSNKLQGLELVMITRQGSRDMFGERTTTPVDFLLFFIYMGSIIGLLFI